MRVAPAEVKTSWGSFQGQAWGRVLGLPYLEGRDGERIAK